MKIAAVVLLSCVALAASKAVELIPADVQNAPTNTDCASICLWAGIYNFPSFQSCTRYIHCIHGFQFELECERGEEFDHVTLRCQPEDEGRCVLEGPIDSSEETSEGTSEETSEGTSEELETEEVTMLPLHKLKQKKQ